MGFEKTKRPRFGLSAKCSVKPPREYWIDYARGLAALAVVWYHLNAARGFNHGLYSELASLGSFGVPVFFFLSGYCIQISISGSGSSLGFLARRFVRIYFPYWASIVLVFIVLGVRFIESGVNDMFPLPASVVQFLALLSAFVDANDGAYGNPIWPIQARANWSYWTLGHEIAFYLIAFIAMWLKRSYIVFLGVALLSISPFARSAFFFLDHFGLFALGLAAAMEQISHQKKYAFALSVLSLASIFFSEPRAVFGISLVAFAFYIVRLHTGPILVRDIFKPLRWLGDISYSLYLIHVPIGVYLVMRYTDAGEERSLGGVMVWDVTIIALCCLIASAMAFLVEAPSIRFGRSISKKIDELSVRWGNILRVKFSSIQRDNL